MFNKAFVYTVALSGLCRCCRKNIFNSQKYLKRIPQVRSNGSRYINTCSLLFNQQYPKEKQTEVNEENCDKDDTKDQKTDNQGNENTGQKSQKNQSEEKSSRTQGIHGKELVLHTFETAGRKEKETFLECLRMYQSQPGRKMERVHFIHAALKYMEEFGVHKDLEAYKEILNIFPKEKMVPTNLFQTMFMHYPREQYCAVNVLEQMEDNSVIPDSETELILLNIFGRHGMPLEKYWKMMYWMPKFKNLNPWPVPNPIPNDALELAKLAMIKISSIDVQSEITIYNTEDIEDSIDKTWIVSAMAPTQKELLKKHDKKTAIYVEGPFPIYVATKSVDYFTLRIDAPQNRKYPEYAPDAVDKLRNPYLETKLPDVLPPTIHEQIDSTIFANCATGTSTKDSVLSWIRCLQKDNPVLGEIPVLFTLRNLSEEKFYVESESKKKMPTTESKKDNDNKITDR